MTHAGHGEAMALRKKRMLQCALGAGIALVMLMIFLFSAQVAEASNQASESVLERILGWFQPLISLVTGRETIAHDELLFILRKIGHFSEYALLGFLIYLMGRLSAWKYPAAVSLLSSVAYAATDEFHQMFTDGRGPSVRDVGIDGCGAFAGILLAMLVCRIISRVKSGNGSRT